MKRRTEITIETVKVTLFGNSGFDQNRPRALVWCDTCCCYVWPVTENEVAIISAETGETEINGEHYVETTEGVWLVCPNSVSPGLRLLGS